MRRGRCGGSFPERFRALAAASDLLPHVNGSGKTTCCLTGKGPFRVRVEPGVDLVAAGSSFGLAKCFELSGQGKDLPGQCRRFESFELGIHADDGLLPDVRMPGSALVRGEGGIVFLDHFGPITFLRKQLVLGQQVVREERIEFPQQCSLSSVRHLP